MMAVLDDGVVARPEVTIAVDVTTRTICAALLRPAGTKGVDAVVLPARMLVPEPMRPGWSRTLAMADSILPHQRLIAVDKRPEFAAAKSVIVPDTIVIDHGKVFVSETFSSACSLLGTSLQPTRPRTPTDKAIRLPSTHASNDAGPAAPPPESRCRRGVTTSDPCPLTPGPAQGETLGSYLHRLAVANNRAAGRLVQLLGPPPPEFSPLSDSTAGWTPESPNRLSALVSRPATRPARALPRLSTSSIPHRPCPGRNM
ncbi:hypothetical protein [Streptomyces sp. NPDC003863]